MASECILCGKSKGELRHITQSQFSKEGIYPGYKTFEKLNGAYSHNAEQSMEEVQLRQQRNK